MLTLAGQKIKWLKRVHIGVTSRRRLSTDLTAARKSSGLRPTVTRGLLLARCPFDASAGPAEMVAFGRVSQARLTVGTLGNRPIF